MNLSRCQTFSQKKISPENSKKNPHKLINKREIFLSKKKTSWENNQEENCRAKREETANPPPKKCNYLIEEKLKGFLFADKKKMSWKLIPIVTSRPLEWRHRKDGCRPLPRRHRIVTPPTYHRRDVIKCWLWNQNLHNWRRIPIEDTHTHTHKLAIKFLISLNLVNILSKFNLECSRFFKHNFNPWKFDFVLEH